ncbi:MAG: DUF1491 family protein [Rhodospirillales bacterium]|nr:DUF1491 family protein [Rhodospirillales bacterium]
MSVRLPSHLWILGIIRGENAAGRPVFVLRKGDPMSGGLLIKINRLDGRFSVFIQQRDLVGRLGWMGALEGAEVSEDDADAYIDRATSRDPDLWVVEVESRDAANPFTQASEYL